MEKKCALFVYFVKLLNLGFHDTLGERERKNGNKEY